MTPTQAESIAAGCLPCVEWCDHTAEHSPDCPAHYRPGVARALVEAARQTDFTLTCAVNALEEAEAILGGEYGDKYGGFCELMASLRKEADAILSSNKTRVEG